MPEPAAPWDTPYAEPRRDVHKSAAVALWVTAAVLVLTGGCLAGSLGVLASQSPDQWIASMGNLTPEQQEQLRQVHPYLRTTAIMVAVSAVVPGILLAVFAFSVRRGKRWAMTAAWILCILLGLYNLMNLVSGVAAGNPAGAIMAIVVFGGVLALIAWSFITVGRARKQPLAEEDEIRDPWETGY
jgi:hypothetical protein